MTALLAGGAGGSARGASDLRSSSRAHLRRGLAGSALLHLALLAVFLHATGGGESIVRTYLTPTDLVTIHPVVPPPPMPPPVDLAPPFQSGGGVIVPVIERPNIRLDPVSPPEPGRTAIDGDTSGSPRDSREAFSPSPATEDPAPGTYRPVDELPVPVFTPTPEYPGWAREAGVTGRVLLNVLVGTDGRVRRVVIDKEENGLGAAASEGIRRWVFRPARMNGAAVATWVAVPVVFRL